MLFTVTMDDESSSAPRAPSPLSVPSSLPRISKGKERAEFSALSHRPYALRGKKRNLPSDTSAEPAEALPTGEGEITSKKLDGQSEPGLPRVEVEVPSPPRPSNRRRTDGGSVATGEVRFPFASLFPFECSQLNAHHRFQDMCGRCIDNKKSECRSQNTFRLSTACQYCAQLKTACGPRYASWAQPILDAINDRGVSRLSPPITGRSGIMFTPHSFWAQHVQ